MAFTFSVTSWRTSFRKAMNKAEASVLLLAACVREAVFPS